MDWKTFIASLVGSLAWPCVAITLIYVLKDRLSELLPRLKKLKYKEAEIEFNETVSELVKEEAGSSEHLLPPAGSNSSQELNVLTRLASVSPQAAVMEAYRAIELAAERAILKAYPNIETPELRHPLKARKLLVEGNILTTEQYEQLAELRNLRNIAAHSGDFHLTGMPIEAYIRLALTLAAVINGHKP